MSNKIHKATIELEGEIEAAFNFVRDDMIKQQPGTRPRNADVMRNALINHARTLGFKLDDLVSGAEDKAA